MQEVDTDIGTLKITRRVGEAVWIAGNVKIEITEMRGRRVVLTFKAPKSIRVVREELLENGQCLQ